MHSIFISNFISNLAEKSNRSIENTDTYYEPFADQD